MRHFLVSYSFNQKKKVYHSSIAFGNENFPSWVGLKKEIKKKHKKRKIKHILPLMFFEFRSMEDWINFCTKKSK